MNIHVRFLVLSLGVVAFEAAGVAGCGSSPSPGGSEPIDAASTSSSTGSSRGDATTEATSSTTDAGEGGVVDSGHDSATEETDAGDAGHDSGSEETDAGDAGHDSGSGGTDAGHDSGAGTDAGDAAAATLSCLNVTCLLPSEVCCPGFNVADGGAGCPDETDCNTAGDDVYECTGQVNCPTPGDVCCLIFGGSPTGSDMATCMTAADCNPNTDTYVCQSDVECEALGESCVPGAAALLTCE